MPTESQKFGVHYLIAIQPNLVFLDINSSTETPIYNEVSYSSANSVRIRR